MHRQRVGLDPRQPGGPAGHAHPPRPHPRQFHRGRPGATATRPLIGQIIYTPGERSARISFLLPADDLDQPSLPDLLESLADRPAAGAPSTCWPRSTRPARPSTPSATAVSACTPGRPSGSCRPHRGHQSGPWQPAAPTDEIAIRSLYQLLVPPLVQSAEPFPRATASTPGLPPERRHPGLRRGHSRPAGHLPPAGGPSGGAKTWTASWPGCWRASPACPSAAIYLAARSYQAWLEARPPPPATAKPAPRQALLVKHLAVAQRVPACSPANRARESITPEASCARWYSTRPIYKN